MSNKIPCGGFYLDDMLNVNDSGELSINGGTPYQQLVTDGEGNARWEDKMVVDSELSDTSENPVQNKVIKSALDALSAFVVHMSVDTSSGSLGVDVTNAEIYNACAEGRLVFLFANLSGAFAFFPLQSASPTDAVFTSLKINGVEVTVTQFAVTDGVVTPSYKGIK